MVDVPKLRKLVEWVEEQDVLAESDRVWDQELWFHQDHISVARAIENKYDPYCGTSMCAAGKLAFDDGWKPVFDSSGHCDRASKDGVEKYFSQIGAEILGLDDGHSRSLFNANNSAGDIRAIAEDYAGERL